MERENAIEKEEKIIRKNYYKGMQWIDIIWVECSTYYIWDIFSMENKLTQISRKVL